MRSTFYQLSDLLSKRKSLKYLMTKFNITVQSCDGEYSVWLVDYPMVQGTGCNFPMALDYLRDSAGHHLICFDYNRETLLDMLQHNPEGFFKHMATYGLTQGVLDVITQHTDEYSITLKAMKGLKAKTAS